MWSNPEVFILIAISYALVPDVIILSTLFKESKLISQIQDTSNPSAILSFSTNKRSLLLESSFRIRKLTFAPVGVLAKFINVLKPFISSFSERPLFNEKSLKDFKTISVSIL